MEAGFEDQFPRRLKISFYKPKLENFSTEYLITDSSMDIKIFTPLYDRPINQSNKE